MTHSEEPRAAEGGLRLPKETEYSFGDFMALNTPYCSLYRRLSEDTVCWDWGDETVDELVSGVWL